MKRTIILASVLALAACNDSKEPTQDQASPPVSQAPASVPTIATVTPPASATEDAEVPKAAAAASETWKCNGPEGSYTLVFTNMKEQTNPRGGSETYGKYRIKGTNSFDVPASGDLSIRGGLYYLNDRIDFQPAQDGSDSIAHLFESGDVSECTKG